MERGLTREQRLEVQKKYSEMREGKRVYIVKWQTTVEEQAEIEELKELKTTNREHQQKRRAASQKKQA